MSYVDNNLTKNETVISKAVLHWFIYFKGTFVLLLSLIIMGNAGSGPFAIFLMGLGVFLLLDAFIRCKTTELAVTNQRVIAKYGLITRNTIEINLSQIEGLNVDQSLLGRLLNYGNIIVGGTGGKKSPIKYIKEPLDFRRTVNEQLGAK